MDLFSLVGILNQIKVLPPELRSKKAAEILLVYINNADVSNAYNELMCE
jgi:hypothetical protein